MLSLRNVDLTCPRLANHADQNTSFTATFGKIVLQGKINVDIILNTFDVQAVKN